VPVRQAKAAQAVRVGEDRERVGLLRPEIRVVVEVVEHLLDRLAGGDAGAARMQLHDRLGGQVLEGDPGSIGLRRDRAGRQVNRDEVVSTCLKEPLDLAAAGDVGMEADAMTLAVS
jgi:hypothetical protein